MQLKYTLLTSFLTGLAVASPLMRGPGKVLGQASHDQGPVILQGPEATEGATVELKVEKDNTCQLYFTGMPAMNKKNCSGHTTRKDGYGVFKDGVCGGKQLTKSFG